MPCDSTSLADWIDSRQECLTLTLMAAENFTHLIFVKTKLARLVKSLRNRFDLLISQRPPLDKKQVSQTHGG